jgi:hypothetical protein
MLAVLLLLSVLVSACVRKLLLTQTEVMLPNRVRLFE